MNSKIIVLTLGIVLNNITGKTSVLHLHVLVSFGLAKQMAFFQE